MLDTANSTENMSIAVHEEEGIILLNFWYRDEHNRIRWFWADNDNLPVYQMSEWFDCRRLYEQIDRLEANGVLEHCTATGARMLVSIHQDRMAMEEAKARLEQLSAKVQVDKRERGLLGRIKDLFR